MSAVRPVLAITIFTAIAGLVLCGIAFGTNHWREYTVDQAELTNQVSTLPDQNQRPAMYFSRNYGFFRECFDKSHVNDGRVGNVEVYKSPLGFECSHPYVGFESNDLDTPDTNHYRILKRVVVAMYSVGLFLGILGLLNIFIGCAWVRPLPVGSSAVILILAAAALAVAGGVWQIGDDKFRDIEVFNSRDSQNQYATGNWIEALKSVTTVSYGWSMIIHWVGTGLILIAGILSLVGCFTADRHHRNKKQMKMAQEQHHQAMTAHEQQVTSIETAKAGYANQGYTMDANSAKAQQALAPYGTYAGYGNGQQMYPGYNTYAGYGYPYDTSYYGMQSYTYQ